MKQILEEKFIEAVGRRKSASARVRIYPVSEKSSKDHESCFSALVNKKPIIHYFPLEKLKKSALVPLQAVGADNLKISVKVNGGGLTGQSEAIRLGLARALVKFNPKFRPRLKNLGFLTRDSRVIERKKPGLRKARRPQQWRKR